MSPSSRVTASPPALRALPGGVSVAEAHASDDELIDGIVRGDERLAEELYERLIPVVDRTLYRLFGRREMDHDDLLQSTFEQIVRTLAHDRFARACSLATWASTVATHVGLTALRSRRRERRVIDRGLDAEPTLAARAGQGDTERTVDARLSIEQLRDILSAMDPAKAEAVFLHDVLGHELAEIAVLTGVSVAAAQSRLVRGRREMTTRFLALTGAGSNEETR